VREACREVLAKMPEDDADRVRGTCLVSWIAAPGRSCTKVLNRRAGLYRAVWLDPRLPRYPCDVIVGIVAHEFAHVVCEHEGETATSESEADRRAEEWGFGREIEAVRTYNPTCSDGGKG
jgi:hypothetical protein